MKLGAAALTRRVGAGDPPAATDLAAMRREASAALAAAPPWSPVDVVLVGGTATNLAKVTDEPTPRTRLRWADIDALDRLLIATPADEIAAAHGVRPARAALLPAGSAIVRAVAEHFGAIEVIVVDTGIREGAADRRGPRRSGVARPARGARPRLGGLTARVASNGSRLARSRRARDGGSIPSRREFCARPVALP